MKQLLILMTATIYAFFFDGCAKVNVFNEPPDYPVIDSISPASGKLGTQIRLYGTGFSTNYHQNAVDINGVSVRVDSPSGSTVVLATITAITGTGPVKIMVNDQLGQGPIFTYDEKAVSINSLSPASGWVDTVVSIRGAGFGSNIDSVHVTFNGHVAVIRKFSDTLILVTAPNATAGAQATTTVLVTVGGKISNGLPFVYALQLKPVILKAEEEWDDGTGFSINVSNLPADDSKIKLFVNGIQVRFNHVSRAGSQYFVPDYDQNILISDDTAITNHVVLNYVDYVVSCNGVTSDPYRYTLIPRISELSPQNTKAGDTLTITGRYFGDRTYPSRVKFFQQVSDSLPDPQIISWKNSEVKVYIGAYTAIIPLPADPTRTIIDFNVIVAYKKSPDTYFGYQIPSTQPLNATVSTAAGTGMFSGYQDGPAATAQFFTPKGIVLDAQGNLFIADQDRIRMLSPVGIVSTFGGSSSGYVDGTISQAKFSSPQGLAIDALGDIYVADLGNNAIRKINFNRNPTVYVAPFVTTVAGGSGLGYVDGPAATAQFHYPTSVTVDQQGNLYVCDQGNNVIRKVAANGTVSTLAGNGQPASRDGQGTAASFNAPGSIVIAPSGNLFVADIFGQKIRMITPSGLVTTVAGNGSAGFSDGPANGAGFYDPSGIAVDRNGILYIADPVNYRIRKLSGGVVSTVAGSGAMGYTDGPALSASFEAPVKLTVDAQGNLFISDGVRIRKLTFQ